MCAGRWPSRRKRGRAKLDLQLSETELEEWVEGLREAAGPALSANRVMGALGSVAASRIARELRMGGSSYAVSSEENSGMHALEAAVRSLQRGDLDAALAGAVDLAGDVRAVLGRHALRPYSASDRARPFDQEGDGALVGEGATALVLKRLEDALRDGDRVYAVIRGVASSTCGTEAYESAAAGGV